MKKFWMVIQDADSSVCSVKHESRASAEAEAERLVKKEGCGFYVMEAVGRCSPAPKVIWEDCEKIYLSFTRDIIGDVERHTQRSDIPRCGECRFYEADGRICYKSEINGHPTPDAVCTKFERKG